MKKVMLFLFAIVCLSLSGCNKDAEIDAFVSELNMVTKEMVEKIEANPTVATIDDAHQALIAKKPGLKAKWKGIKNAIGLQVSFGKRKEIEDSVANNIASLTNIASKNNWESGHDPDAAQKFEALMEEYRSIFEPDK